MAYLSGIIKEIETHFHVTVHGTYQEKHTIDGIFFLTENDQNISYLSPNILYLADFSVYATARLYGDVLFVGCGTQTPLADGLYIEEPLELIALYHVIAQAFLSYQQVELKKDALFRVLHGGRGLDTLLQTAYKYLENPIVLCDSSYTVLASYPQVSDPVFELRRDRLVLKSVFSENMKTMKLTDRIYHSVYPFPFQHEEYSFNWIYESVRIKRAVVGYLNIRCINRDYTDADLELVHALTQMISIQLQKDDSYQNPLGIKYDMFLKDLFEGHFPDEEAACKYLRLLGVQPECYYYLIVCGFQEDAQELMAHHYYWQQLSAIFPNSITGMFGNRFVTLVPTAELLTLNEKQESRLETFLTMNHMLAAVSYVFDTLTESAAYFAQSTYLLSAALTAYCDYPIIFYGAHYLEHLLAILKDKKSAPASIHPAIKAIQKHDEAHHTQYLDTLSAFFANNRNAQATANALFIHKSTLFYRFDKLKQLFDIRFDKPDALFAYEYSLRLIKQLR